MTLYETRGAATRLTFRVLRERIILLFALVITACQPRAGADRPAADQLIGGFCDGCEGIYEQMPRHLSWQTRMGSPAEPGEPLEITGVIYRGDGKTPARDVILYVYHTDAQGHYSPAPSTTGWARRHGHLRGWMKTNSRGEYRFVTIKPAPYPTRTDPAHIHPILKEPGKNEYYIDEYVFDDDPLLTPQQRSRRENRGGSGVLHLQKRDSTWVGRRDIILGLNIPNYD